MSRHAGRTRCCSVLASFVPDLADRHVIALSRPSSRHRPRANGRGWTQLGRSVCERVHASPPSPLTSHKKWSTATPSCCRESQGDTTRRQRVVAMSPSSVRPAALSPTSTHRPSVLRPRPLCAKVARCRPMFTCPARVVAVSTPSYRPDPPTRGRPSSLCHTCSTQWTEGYCFDDPIKRCRLSRDVESIAGCPDRSHSVCCSSVSTMRVQDGHHLHSAPWALSDAKHSPVIGVSCIRGSRYRWWPHVFPPAQKYFLCAVDNP
jgi:hypothetical protein